MKRIATLTVLLAACCVMLVLAITRARAVPDTNSRASSAAGDEQAREDETSRAGGARPWRSAPAPIRAEVAAPPPAAPAVPEASPEAKPKTNEQLAAELDSAFLAEPASPAAADTRVKVATAFREDRAKGAMLREVDCRGTRCKLIVEFADNGADKRVMAEIFNILQTAEVDIADLGFVVPQRATATDGTISATIHLYKVSPPTASL